MAEPFSLVRSQQVADVFGRHGVRYLFLGKGGAILLGYSDTTQDVDLFVEKESENSRRIIAALVEIGFELDEPARDEILRGKDFIQIRSGPFDLDLVFAPDGIEAFPEAQARSQTVEGMPVCHIDDIIRSKRAANRVRDREALPRLEAFARWWKQRYPGR